jgi:hypothetical protein
MKMVFKNHYESCLTTAWITNFWQYAQNFFDVSNHMLRNCSQSQRRMQWSAEAAFPAISMYTKYSQRTFPAIKQVQK